MTLSRYSGAGNTFVILENETLSAANIAAYCLEYEVDGLIILHDEDSMRYYNADGYEAAMCGNGLRCLIKYLWDSGRRRELYEITTRAGLQKGRVVGDEVICYLQPPSLLRWNQELWLREQRIPFHFLNTSVPHAVFFMMPDDVETLGREIRFHPYFAPEGTNVNFVTPLDHHSLRLRTYERGVERETLACGTGAIASALAAHKEHGLSSPITVYVQSGESLAVSFQPAAASFTAISLQGPARASDSSPIVTIQGLLPS